MWRFLPPLQESAAKESTMSSSFMQISRRQGSTFGILVAAILFVHLPFLPMFVFTGLGNWLYLCIFLSFGLMASLPFLLRKVAPGAANFDRQCFPNAWSQWCWALVLIPVMFITGILAAKLTTYVNFGSHQPFYVPSITSFSRLTIATNGLLWILMGPVAEEIFWRGYVLDQLRKLTHWAVALPVHAVLFALAHFIFAVTLLSPLAAFSYALVLGVWRIRFRSLLPLILSHILINMAATVPILNRDYQTLCLTEEVTPDYLVAVRSNPKCQQIASLTRQPAAEALPVLIGFLADNDDPVRTCAIWAISQYRRDDAKPYVKEALASNNPKTVDGALFIIGLRRYSDLREEVRHIVWSAHDLHFQMSATITLHDLGDTDGIRKIAERHPDKKLREVAERMLRPSQ